MVSDRMVGVVGKKGQDGESAKSMPVRKCTDPV